MCVYINNINNTQFSVIWSSHGPGRISVCRGLEPYSRTLLKGRVERDFLDPGCSLRVGVDPVSGAETKEDNSSNNPPTIHAADDNQGDAASVGDAGSVPGVS